MASKRQTATPGKTPTPAREDVIWGNVNADDDGGFTLVPLDPEEEQRRVRQRETMVTVDVVYDDEEDDQRFDYVQPQFTLKHLIITQAVVALILALVRLLAPGMMAGALGIAAMLLAAGISILEPEDRRVNITWWCLFAMYLLGCVIALVTS